MAKVALSSLDQLAASVRHSYVSANELILRSSQDAASAATANKADETASGRQDSFIINHNDGTAPESIPLSQFYSNSQYYLSSMRLDLPCYTISGKRFFGGTVAEIREVHPFRPTLWQNLFYLCHLYHIEIKASVGGNKMSIRPATHEEAAQARPKRSAEETNWIFSLNPKQQKQIQTIPPTASPLIHSSSAVARAWRWLKGKAA